MNEKTKIAIVPGSFDPITNGHIDIVKRACESYDKVYVAVMINSSKKYMFTLEQRKKIAEAALKEHSKAEVISSDGMLWELAKELNAIAIVKGYRNERDLKYEQEMAEFNSAHYPEAQTVLLKADDALRGLSSTVIREMILTGKNIEKYLPIAAIDEIGKIVPSFL